MQKRLERYQAFLEVPLAWISRVMLLIAVALIFFVFKFPLWTMSFESNQYPDPLRLSIHVNHLEGQKTPSRDDLREINSLNHYIGMRPLLESDFSEFLWMPFVIGFFALIILRAVIFGTRRDLVDIAVLYLYFGLSSGWNFFNRLYDYGHNLNPEAAIKVEPFTPPFFGRVQIANFWVESYPAGGSYSLFLVAMLVIAALLVSFFYRADASTDHDP